MTTLIDVQYIFDNTNIQKNVKGLDRDIILAQALHIQPVIGSKLLDSLIYLIDNSLIIPGSPFDLLWKQLQPSLAYWTYYEAVPFLHYKPTENGFLTRTSGDNTPITEKELELIQTNIRNKAEIFMKIVLDYIEANINQFPQYQLEFKTKDTDQRKEIVRGGIFLPRRQGCNFN
jgi:hypothetical protein